MKRAGKKSWKTDIDRENTNNTKLVSAFSVTCQFCMACCQCNMTTEVGEK